MRILSVSNRDWIIVALINVTVGATVLYEQRVERISQTVAVATSWASFVLLNLFVVLGVYLRERRNGKPMRRHFVLGVALVALSCIAITSFSLKTFRPKERYAQLAFSNIPLSSIEPERDRLVVELIRKRAETSKQYAAAAARISPIDPPLYSPASFGNEEMMNKTASSLQSVFELDQEYAASLKVEMESFRARMAQVDPAYLRSWTAAGTGGDREEDRIMDLESRWVRSVSALYAFAKSHEETIAVRNGEFEIGDPKVKVEFEQLITSSEEFQRELQSERSKALAHQRTSASNSDINQAAY